jgi:ACS family hexuronate transporter-like MFS transporter
MLAMAAVGSSGIPMAILLISMGGMGHQLTGTWRAGDGRIQARDRSRRLTAFAVAAWIGGTLFSLLIGALAGITGFSPLFVCLGFST